MVFIVRILRNLARLFTFLRSFLLFFKQLPDRHFCLLYLGHCITYTHLPLAQTLILHIEIDNLPIDRIRIDLIMNNIHITPLSRRIPFQSNLSSLLLLRTTNLIGIILILRFYFLYLLHHCLYLPLKIHRLTVGKYISAAQSVLVNLLVLQR